MKQGIVDPDYKTFIQFFPAGQPANVVGCFQYGTGVTEYLVEKVKKPPSSWAANISGKLSEMEHSTRMKFESYTGKTLEEYKSEYQNYLWITERRMTLIKSNKDMKKRLITLED